MKTILGLTAVTLIGAGAIAQDMSGHEMAQMPMTSSAITPGLHQGGQAAFIAIAEATAALEADPNTDWSKVNVDALRQHLVDMDNVTVRADVVRADIPGGERFAITSADPRVRDSISRMTRLHSSMANKEGPYHLVPTAIPNGTELTVTGSNSRDQAKIRGLGFFGLLTEGVHHELHHMMLARGEPMSQ